MGAAAVDVRGEWGECLVPESPVPAAMAAEVRRATGAVPGWLPRTSPCPWLVRAATALIQKPVAYASPELCDLVTLVVSQDNSCRYCYGMQRAVLRIHGHSDAYIDALVRDFHVSDLSTAERAALEFARRISRADPRPGRAEFERVVNAGMSRLAVAEVAFAAASTSLTNRVATLVALPAERLEGAVRSPLFRAHAEAEARAYLAEDGLGARDVDEILGTLGSARLDAREARLVPFARETVRYQPAASSASGTCRATSAPGRSWRPRGPSPSAMRYAA